MLVRPEVILFDLDDTLISFEGTAEPAWEKCCQEFTNKHVVPFDTARLLAVINASRQQFWNDPERSRLGRRDLPAARRLIVSSALQELNFRDESLSNELADSYSCFREHLIHVFPNTLSTLEALKATGIRLGLLTNGTSAAQRGKLDRFQLGPYFEHILVEGELGYGKPDARIYTDALSLFGVSPQSCWMVGDNLIWDVQAPQTLGIRAIWHDYRKTGLPSDAVVLPDHTIQDITEILALLQTRALQT
jgi:putative hydrolase of the HAD superfamily